MDGIAMTRWIEETVIDMPTSVSGKQFISHFWEIEKVTVHFSIYLWKIKRDNVFLNDELKRKNLRLSIHIYHQYPRSLMDSLDTSLHKKINM